MNWKHPDHAVALFRRLITSEGKKGNQPWVRRGPGLPSNVSRFQVDLVALTALLTTQPPTIPTDKDFLK